ncbi:MAG: transglutaminase-like domain-containing protein, partial [Clostridia bacterium]
MRHLQRFYRYSLTPASPPENQDFVTYFLYVGKEGYCTYFASAMTVLCRMADLPARYVEGFLAQPTGDGSAYVTGLDAHAWTEVYFEGFGW